jgi:lipid-binding SYLF domain-containing protein
MKILLAGGGKGQGIAVDNATKKITYLKILELQAGSGMGVKKFRTIFVCETKDSMEHFVNNGREFGGQATAAANSDKKGGSYQGAVRAARSLDVPAHRQRIGARTYRQGDEVLQRRRTELNL